MPLGGSGLGPIEGFPGLGTDLLGGTGMELVPAAPSGAPNASLFVVDEVSPSNPEGSSPTRLDVHWRPDGTMAYSARQSADISQNDVSPAWGIQPGNWSNRITTISMNNLRSIWWSPDGTKLSASLRLPSTAFTIRVWDQSATPWDLAVLGAALAKNIGVGGGGPADHIWSADGLTLWQFYQGSPFQIIKYTASVAFDPTTLSTAVANFDLTPDTGTTVRTIAFSTDGTVMYAMSGQTLVSWDLSVAFDITTMANFQTGPAVSGVVGIPRGLRVRTDNTDVFVEGDQNQMRVAWFRVP